MLKTLRKHWHHLAIWTVMLIYLMVAPALHIRFIVKHGKPVQQNLEIPAPTDQILFAVNNLDPIFIDDQDLFYLWGWAFLNAPVAETSYERWIVLHSDQRTYFFITEILERSGVQEAFAHLGMNLLDSGFSALMAKEAIEPGIYHIGILFRDKKTEARHYVVTNKVLIRTANQLELQYEKLLPPFDGYPIQFVQELPIPSNQILFSVDRIDSVNVNGQDLHNLWGWAFLENVSNQDVFDRWIVLQPELDTTQAKDEPIFFAVKSFERLDVQKAFEHLNMDLSNSGFSTYIAKETLPLGRYRVGLLFKNKNDGTLHYTITNKLLMRVADQLQLKAAP